MVTFTATLAGSIDDFDATAQANFKQALADEVGVLTSQITLIVGAASSSGAFGRRLSETFSVTAKISANTESIAATIEDQLMADALETRLTNRMSALGTAITVTEVSTPTTALEAVDDSLDLGSSSQEQRANNDDNDNTGAIVGGVVGAFVVVILSRCTI